jgi:site-specific recombinase XerC
MSKAISNCRLNYSKMEPLSVVRSTKEVYIRNERATKKRNLVSYEEGISTQNPKYRLLHIACQVDFPKVRAFLESVARGSKSSMKSYEIGLKHLECFLNTNNNCSDYYQYNVETIMLALQSNKLNVYELLDSFVSYLVNMPHQPPIAPTSIALYVYAVRSYLQYHDIDINPSKFRRRVRLPKVPREDERPIDSSEIRKILLSCNNRYMQ